MNYHPTGHAVSFPSRAVYTEDITVAGSLLRDKISTLFDSIVGADDLNGPYLQLKVDKVKLVDPRGVEQSVDGTVHVTTTHTIFRSEQGTKELWILNGLIASVERGPLSVAGCPLIIRCKHFQVVTFVISRDKACQDLYETLKRCPETVNVAELLAFEARDVGEDARGWSRLDWAVEFSRQGLSDKWTETTINHGYRSCDTYPEHLWVPTSASGDVLLGSCRFRSRGRLPVLSYYHKANDAALCRCSQPLSGFSARCVEDEKLMQLIGKANTNNETLYLIDTRPIVNAMVNKVQGKGFEDERNYDKMRFHNFDIENIHVMRTSQLKLVEACSKARTMSEFLKGVESSGWLKHVKAVVECGIFLAVSIARGISCVVHCSDGWDRTSQTVALAQLLLDPFYRTIHGFQLLVEKDWLAFGHKFDDRCGHVGALNDEAAKEVSPIFTQFLDCVFQITRHYPRAFQFNERYLIELHEQVYSCQYGTFIGNCEKDRRDLCLDRRTKSLWTYLDSRHDDFLNPFYEPTTFSSLLEMDTRSASFVVWHGLYNRFDTGLLPKENINDTMMVTMEHVGVLDSHIASLRARIAELRGVLGKSSGGQSMIDSGHGSSSGTEDRHLERVHSQESGVYELANVSSEEALVKFPVRWQSLRDVTHCAGDGCRAEFASSVDRRIHCHRCGKIFCRRCVLVTTEDRERLCSGCRTLLNINGK